MSSITTSVPTMPPMVQAPGVPGPRPFHPGAPAGPTLTVQDVIRILKRFIFLIIGIFSFVFILSIVGTYIWAKFYPSYYASALVAVSSPIAPQALSGNQQTVGKDIIEQAMNTQAQIIKSQSILQQALEDPEVKQTKWFGTFKIGDNVDTSAALIDMQKCLSVSPIRDTYFVQVGFSGQVPKECATITNVILDKYYQNVRSGSQEKTRNELKQFQDKSTSLTDDLKQKLAGQERFRASKNIPLIEQRRNNIGDQVTALTQLLAQSMTEKDQAQSLYEMYNQPGALERMAETPEMRQMVEGDTFVRYYTQMMADLRIGMTSAREKGANNRSVKDMESRIKTVEREMNERKRQVISDTYRDMRERTKVQLDTVTSQVMGLQNRLAEAKLELSELEKELAQYMSTEREIVSLRNQLEDVDKKTFELRIQLDSPELVRVNIAMRAVEPLERNSPKWSVNLPAGFVLGLMLGVGLAFLLEFMSTTVKTPADVLRQLNMPFLGQIPSQDEDETSPAQMQKLLLESPHSMLAESFRQFRANFLFCAPAEQQRSILITSCSPSEGKTCISVNLATTLALAGRKVLLVDANFRRPGVAQAFGLEGITEGLSNILIGQGNPTDLIHRTSQQNLDILASGPLPPNPAELLSGEYLRKFIETFSKTYETIIFDGPPVLVVSDAMVMSTAMDGVLMVVRAGFSLRGAIQRAKEQLRRVNAKLLGVVLNDVKITRGGYFREMYKTYYEYQTPAALPESPENPEAKLGGAKDQTSDEKIG
jgi:polysaccharide biosynthesis transport protein